jgi:hypothetical protein
LPDYSSSLFQLLMATLTVGQTGQDETIRVETDLVTLNITVSTPVIVPVRDSKLFQFWAPGTSPSSKTG